MKKTGKKLNISFLFEIVFTIESPEPIRFQELPAYLKIKVFNTNGNLVEQFNQKADLLNKVNISHIAQGAYFVEVLDENYQLINRTKIIFVK